MRRPSDLGLERRAPSGSDPARLRGADGDPPRAGDGPDPGTTRRVRDRTRFRSNRGPRGRRSSTEQRSARHPPRTVATGVDPLARRGPVRDPGSPSRPLLPAHGAVPPDPGARQGGTGRGLRGPRLGTEPRGSPEANPGQVRRRPEQPCTVPPGGRGHWRTRTSRRRPRLQPGPSPRRPTLLRHAVHPGRHSPRRDRAIPRGRARATQPERAGPGAAQPAQAVHRRLQRDRLCAQPGHRPPGHQARQHPPGQLRRDAGC